MPEKHLVFTTFFDHLSHSPATDSRSKPPVHCRACERPRPPQQRGDVDAQTVAPYTRSKATQTESSQFREGGGQRAEEKHSTQMNHRGCQMLHLVGSRHVYQLLQ
ncbi:hypothetical protein JOB18_042423 [Solea senegalensis]|uniref:Uncharacterized protein n=1 Tax=Solea senegalensis TaxID=28829 RepID=A0AAV6T1H2_SOLSE|nr:hypothetical protein JOB18_042423 [Solea senegalensis]